MTYDYKLRSYILRDGGRNAVHVCAGIPALVLVVIGPHFLGTLALMGVICLAVWEYDKAFTESRDVKNTGV